MYSISWNYGRDYKEVAAWNNIKSPYIIYEDQMVRVVKPRRGVTKAADKIILPKPKSALSPKKPEIIKRPALPAVVAKVKEKQRQKEILQKTPIHWQWPTKGKLLANLKEKPTRAKGVNIIGRRNQPIHASAFGRVVYSGDGLVRYGKLLIIKHNDQYISAYAHNDQLLVKEGDYVKAGQLIARMGDTGTDRVMLHFEIRKNGKPVYPLRYLPKRKG